MTLIQFLATLPGILGLAGLIIYVTWQNKKDSSPIVKSVVSIIKHKGKSLPELNNKLNAHQLFNLINKHPELRQSLSENDYKLLTRVIGGEERNNYIIGVIFILCLVISGFFHYKIYINDSKIKIDNVSVIGLNENKPSIPNTLDDIRINWTYNGNNEELKIQLLETTTNKRTEVYKANASENYIKIPKSHIEEWWGQPSLNDVFDIKVVIQTENKTFEFGPFEFKTALHIFYYYNEQTKEFEIMTQTTNTGLFNHNYDINVLAYPNNSPEPSSIKINVREGKGKGKFPDTFIPNLLTVKVIYLGSHPNQLVCYTNMNE